VSDPRTRLVAEGYDTMIDTWESWKGQIDDDPRGAWTADFADRLTPGARVLELGCGGGTAETELLAARFALTGVDLSARQLERARRRVPSATFLYGDLTEIDFEPESFEGVVSYYVFNHVPRELLAPTLRRIRGWLVAGGILMAVFGTSDLESWTGDFLGAPSFFSSFPPEENARLVRGVGFSVVRDETVTIREPDGPARFQWMLALR
jgi:SAM-dependent methyltransferase